MRRRKSVQKSEMMSDSYFMFKDNNNWISAASKSVITRLASSLVKVVPSAAHSEAGGRIVVVNASARRNLLTLGVIHFIYNFEGDPHLGPFSRSDILC